MSHTIPVVANAAPAVGPAQVLVASNAALAPVIDSGKLHDAATHLHHIPLTADNSTDAGGITMHPGTFASGEPIVAAHAAHATHITEQPIRVAQAPIQPIVAEPLVFVPVERVVAQSSTLVQAPLAAQSPLSPAVNFHTEEQTASLAQFNTQPASMQAPLTLANNGALAQRIGEGQLRAEKSELHHVTPSQTTLGVTAGSLHPVGAIVSVAPSASELAAEKSELHHVRQPAPNALGSIHSSNAVLSTGEVNHPPAAALIAEKGDLNHVRQPAPNALGSIHPSNAVLTTGELNHPPASALIAEKAALHHVKLDKAPVTASGGQHLIAQPDAGILPTQLGGLGGEAATNAGLASTIQPQQLQQGHKALEHVSDKDIVPSHLGGQHAQGAQLGHAAIDAAALQHVRDTQLTHVAIERAPATRTGGVHLIAQPDTTLIPEEQGALTGTVFPAQLAKAHKALEHVPASAHVQPSRYGGVHAAGAQTGVVADPVALQYVKEHGLNHVKLDQAPVTASGGAHMITQPDASIIPEQAASSEPHHAALAGVVAPADLRAEKRALDHVAIERQHATASGGVQMSDTSAAEPLSILDRFKSVLGLETHAEQRAHAATAPGLGRVVDVIPVAIQAHTINTPAQAAAPASKLAQAPQNAQLAQVVTTQDLRAESAQLLPVAGSAALAPVVSSSALRAEAAHLQHVPNPDLPSKVDVLVSSEQQQLQQQPQQQVLVAAGAPITAVSVGPVVAASTPGGATVFAQSAVVDVIQPVAVVDRKDVLLSGDANKEYTARAGEEASYVPIR